MTWINKDGLNVKFAREEANKVSGGDVTPHGDRYRYEMYIPFSEVQSTAQVIAGSVANPGSQGVILPKGFFIEHLETVAETPFTSSGTIGTSTLQIGLVKASDRTTAYSATGLTTASFVGSLIDGQGERQTVQLGSTGCGASVGTLLTEDVVVSAGNTQHASHPFTGGVLKLSILGYFPGQ